MSTALVDASNQSYGVHTKCMDQYAARNETAGSCVGSRNTGRNENQLQRDPAILENLFASDLRDYGKITSALKLRFGDAYLTELLHGQLHNWTLQAKKDLTTFANEVQSLAKPSFVNSPIETQEYVAAQQFVENIADLDVQ
nr:unnamed protein product [Callosobruchus chinensis]